MKHTAGVVGLLGLGGIAIFAGIHCSSAKAPAAVLSEAGSEPDGDTNDTGAPMLEAAVDAGNDATPPFGPLPDNLTLLSQTDLYEDLATKKISSRAVLFAPKYTLWSDGAEKRRWMILPPGTVIDTSDMDHWKFPVGTRFYKEFAREGKLLETRLVYHRADTGKFENDYFVGSFVWKDDESDAELAPAGKDNLRGTDHDAPPQVRCFTCHQGDRGRILGFSAIQLSQDNASVTIATLAAQGLLSAPPPAGVDYRLPTALPARSAALGYLHANCGHCHNPVGEAWPDVQMVLRLSTNEVSAPPFTAAAGNDAGTITEQTTVGVALQRWHKTGYVQRIAAGHPEESGLFYRITHRGDLDQMPPIATEYVDDTGAATIRTWIDGL